MPTTKNQNKGFAEQSFDCLTPLSLLDQGEAPDLDYRQSSELIDRGFVQFGGDLHEGTYFLEMTDSGKIYLDAAKARTVKADSEPLRNAA